MEFFHRLVPVEAPLGRTDVVRREPQAGLYDILIVERDHRALKIQPNAQAATLQNCCDGIVRICCLEKSVSRLSFANRLTQEASVALMGKCSSSLSSGLLLTPAAP